MRNSFKYRFKRKFDFARISVKTDELMHFYFIENF